MAPIERKVENTTTAIDAAAAAAIIVNAITGADTPAPPPPDLTPLVNEIQSLRDEVRALRGELDAARCRCAAPSAPPPPLPRYMAPTAASQRRANKPGSA